MANRTWISIKGMRERNHFSIFVGLSFFAFVLIASTTSCSSGEEVQETSMITQEGSLDIEGTVKTALGNYMFIPEEPGFDIVVQGTLDTGDISTLVGKKVRGKAEFSPEQPSILIATEIEIEEDGGLYRSIFTPSGEVTLEDYIGLAERDGFEVLNITSYNKAAEWEGKTKAKVYGTLEQVEEAYLITVLNEEDKEIGKILVDNISDFALYYVNKLRLFDKFWFYIDVKESVDARTRRRSKEMFHADIHFAGLF